jgi:hypothetical protein
LSGRSASTICWKIGTIPAFAVFSCRGLLSRQRLNNALKI